MWQKNSPYTWFRSTSLMYACEVQHSALQTCFAGNSGFSQLFFATSKSFAPQYGATTS
jgi:hypothetical protein